MPVPRYDYDYDFDFINLNSKVFDNYAVTVQIQDDQYVIQLFDTAGQEDYDRWARSVSSEIFSLQVTFDRLPQHRRVLGLLQHHQPRLVRQREGEVGSGDQGIVGKSVKISTITMDQGIVGKIVKK